MIELDRRQLEDLLQAREDRLAKLIGERITSVNLKLDALAMKLDALSQSVSGCQAKREHCMKVQNDIGQTVWGNGRDGLVGRTAKLEEVSRIGGKGFWALVSLLSALVAGAVLAVGGTLLAWMKG